MAPGPFLRHPLASLLLAGLLGGCHPAPPKSSVPTGSQPQSDALYFIMVDRFDDQAPNHQPVDRDDPQGWHGGDLAGVRAHLDQLATLGFGGVWLTPITASRQDKLGPWGAYHGYWVSDLTAPEPRFGTMEDARALSDALHARGMGLYLDMVYNHVAYDIPLTTERPEWFHHNGDIQRWDDAQEIVTHDVHGLPDLAQEREEVYQYLLGATRHWVEAVHPDGLRIDAVRHLPLGFLRRLGADLRADYPTLQLLGEVFEGDPVTLAARWRDDQLDAVFDFPLHYALKDVFCDDAPPGRLGAVLSQDTAYGAALQRPNPPLLTFLDNHDVARITSACHDDPARVHQALAFLLTARGRPVISWGTELDLRGAEEPANRADMPWPQLSASPEPPTQTLIRTLLRWRAAHPALRHGRTLQLGLDSFVRLGTEEAVWIQLNRGAEPISVAPPAWLEELELGARWQIAGLAPPQPLGRELAPHSTAVVFYRGVARPPPERLVTLTLAVQGAPAEDWIVTGAGSALGNWTPAKGVRSLTAPSGSVLTLKPALRSGTWGPGPNRYLYLDRDTTLELRWGGS